MTQLPDVVSRTEIRDGMKITWHQAIPMDDGLVLRADVFAPIDDGKYPVILTYGVYAKGLAYQDGYPQQWDKMVEDHPEILEGSTNKYQNWEVTDPERWVPHGYVVVRVDSRGAGWSPGFMDCNSPREIAGPLPVHRVGGHAAVEQRQGRHARHLLLRQQPVARGAAASAASRGDHSVGRPERPLPRLRLPRRHPQRVPEALGQAPGRQRPVRPAASERRKNPEHRRVGRRARHALRRGAGEEPRRRLRGAEAAPVRRRVAPRALGRPLHRSTVPLLTCANWGGQGIHPRGNFNGFTETPRRSRSGSRCTATRTGRCSRPATASRCRSASSTTS